VARSAAAHALRNGSYLGQRIGRNAAQYHSEYIQHYSTRGEVVEMHSRQRISSQLLLPEVQHSCFLF
jgi:hypothetical protein